MSEKLKSQEEMAAWDQYAAAALQTDKAMIERNVYGERIEDAGPSPSDRAEKAAEAADALILLRRQRMPAKTTKTKEPAKPAADTGKAS